MSDTVQGVFYTLVFLAIVFAASRVLARFTGAKYSRAMMPLAPTIGGTFSTDSLSHGWMEGAYRDRRVTATAIPGVSSIRDGDPSDRYNAFEVALLDVPGASDWSVKFGSHSLGQILSRAESWELSADDEALRERLEGSALVTELESFAGAGVRGYPTVRYEARAKRLTHRDNVGPGIAPPPEHFRKQLELVLRLARVNEQVNPAAPAS